MNVVISPYHLTTREPPAMAALLLAGRVTTFLPAPLQGNDAESLGRAVEMSPRYLKFMDSWRWSARLWDEGIIARAFAKQTAEPDVRHVCGVLSADPHFASLRALVHDDLFDDEKRYLDAVAHDLLRGGPDPGVSLPVAAAMDRFACRHGMVVMRSHASSVAQRAEEKLARRFLAVAVPTVLQADAARFLALRDALADPLTEFRNAVSEATAMLYRDPSGPVDRDLLSEVDHAARAYAMEFEAAHQSMAAEARSDEVRLIASTVTLSLAAVPVDAVLRSGLTAMKTLVGSPKLISGASVAALATRDPLAGRFVASMIVKPLGRAASGGR